MFRRVTVSGICCLIATSVAVAAPQVGDKAPKIKVAKWMTTAPPALPGEKDADKHVYVVEFWATWCGPCRKNIPHLADLHRKYQKDGLIIIGVSNEDQPTIEKFLKKGAGGKAMDMPYHVASDDDNATNEVWMADIPGIPHAFIVDKTNTVVWAGHPALPDMTDALDKVLAGKFDVQTAKNAAATSKKFEELMAQANAAAQSQDNEKLAKIADQMIALKPQDIMPYLMKRHVLTETKREAEIPSLETQMEAAMKDSVDGLRQIIESQLETELGNRSPGMLYRSARRAEELTKGRDPDILSLLGQLQCSMGMIDAAIATQERALGLATDVDRDAFKKVLKYYKEAKSLSAGNGP